MESPLNSPTSTGISVELTPKNNRTKKRSFDPKLISVGFDKKNNVVIKDSLSCKSASSPNGRRMSSPLSSSVESDAEKSRNQTRQMYSKVLSLQQQKEKKHEERLRLQNRLSLLKTQLQRALRDHAREESKKEQLQMIHREQEATKRVLDQIKVKRQRQVIKNRTKFKKRNLRMKEQKELKLKEALAYKKQLAKNARLQSQVREKVSKKHAEREYYRKVKLRNKVLESKRNMGSKKQQHVNKMLESLSMDYARQAERAEKEIEKEDKAANELSHQVEALAEMIQSMNKTGKLPNTDMVEALVDMNKESDD